MCIRPIRGWLSGLGVSRSSSRRKRRKRFSLVVDGRLVRTVMGFSDTDISIVISLGGTYRIVLDNVSVRVSLIVGV